MINKESHWFPINRLENLFNDECIISHVVTKLIVNNNVLKKKIDIKKKFIEHLHLYPGTDSSQAEHDFYLMIK